MCVAISLMPGASLDEDELVKMDRANADGAGVAWADPEDGLVHWYKTMSVKPAYLKHLLDHWVGSPRLLHFRLATAGGRKTELCHPFAMNAAGDCRPVGKAKRVMIHNGHYANWVTLGNHLEKEDLLPDKGPWSDTRLIAYLAHQDPDWLEIIGGRVATLSGDGQLTHLGDWSDLREGVRVSNLHWQTTYGYTGNWKNWRDREWDTYVIEKEAKEARKESRKARKPRGLIEATDVTPWKSPYNGKSYKVNAAGDVVEVAASPDAGETD